MSEAPNSRGDVIAAITADTTTRSNAHDALRSSASFTAQLTRLDRLTSALVTLVRASWMESSRHLPLLDGYLLYTSTDDTLESVVAIRGLIGSGVHNAARRELRYLLESSVKHVYVDQQLPSLDTHSRADRIAYLASDVPRSGIDVVKDLHVLFGDSSDLPKFRADVKSTWAGMASYVHPSVSQTKERLDKASRGAYIGFEDVKALSRVVDEIARVYDMLGVLWLMGAGPSPAGEILTAVEVPGWAFARTKWLPAMSRHYDYKAERKAARP